MKKKTYSLEITLDEVEITYEFSVRNRDSAGVRRAMDIRTVRHDNRGGNCCIRKVLRRVINNWPFR